MTVRAPAATTGGLRGWLTVRHSLGLEVALVVALYGVYELARGRVSATPRKRTVTLVSLLRSSARCISSSKGSCSMLRMRCRVSPGCSASPT